VTDRKRWNGCLVGALALVGIGLITAEPFVVAATTVPLSYVAYGALSAVPSDTDLEATRSVLDPNPIPGEPTTIELTVTNTSKRALSDVRVIDGVPEALTVVDGTARCCVSLQPDETATLTYDVLAKRGTHTFDSPVVRVRTLSASDAVSVTLPVSGDTDLSCSAAVESVPRPESTVLRAGTLPTDSGGSGLEFHATRRYRHGDPVSRINWRQYAKTDELTTIDYREEQAARTVLVVDARLPARVIPEPGYPSGAELGAYGAKRLFHSLARTGAVPAVGVVGASEADRLGPDGLLWADTTGDHARSRIDQLFATLDELPHDTGDTDSDDGIQSVLARLPPAAQVVVFSPLTDDWAVSLIEALTVRGYATTLVSPDLFERDTPGTEIADLERQTRIREIELDGGTVVDWNIDEHIDVAIRASLAELHNIS
jgi:uncharacterized repeat protein (TIGR01451 family)